MKYCLTQTGTTVEQLDNFLNSVYILSVAGVPNLTVAAQIVQNFGIPVSTVPGSAYQIAYDYVVQQLDATPYALRGQVVSNITFLFANLIDNPVFGTYATAYNVAVQGALTYAESNTGNAPFDPANPEGQTFTLTTGIDTFVGGASNDTFIGNSVPNTSFFGGIEQATFTPLDSLDGGAGTNTFNIVSTIDVVNQASATVKNIQTANITGAFAIGATGLGNAFDTSAWTGLTSLNILKGANAYLNAAGTTAVAVSGVTGALEVDGGSTVNVTAGTGSADVTIGATTVSTGAVTVTDTAQLNNNIKIDGGTAVTVTASDVLTGTIEIGNGGAATDLPTGAVSVTSTGTAYAITDASNTLGNITVKGGSTVTVNQTAYSSTTAAATDTTNVGVVRTQSAVSVTGGAATTAVTVNQSAAVASVNAVVAVAGATEAVNEVFVALTSGQTLIVGGLTFKAGAAGTTAAQTAAAFANLSSGAAAGNSTLGSYSGSFTGWNTGAVTATSTVLFSSSTANTAGIVAPIFTGTGTGPAGTQVTAGVTTVVAVTGVAGVAANTVLVADVNYLSATKAGTITTVTASNFTTANINDNALTTLNVTNGSGNIIIDNTGLTTATNKTLALNINGQTAGTLDDGDIYTTLNVTTSGANSTLSNITLGAMTALTVAGDKALTLSSATGASKLATVTVSGSAGLSADLSVIAATVTSVNASATSGNNTITLDATKATYTGGTGVDSVTTSAGVSKAISLGAGNDKLTLASGTTTATANMDGGEGTDTLVMVAANAATASASNVFEANISSFEKLTLTGGTTDTVNLANLDDISSVSTSGNTALTLTNMANAGTLEITGATTAVRVVMTDATGVADSFNVALASAATIAAGTVTVAGVERIAITSNDTDAATANSNSLTLVADAATAITVSGDAALSLTSTAALVTTVNASAMTAGLTYTTAATAQTVTGGTGNDVLTAGAGTAAQTLIGGAGNDTLTTNAGISTLTGGLGADKFVIQTPGANVNIYATTDATIGDTIQFASLGVETFNATKLILGANAVFQDYANLAASGDGSANAALSWFQFAGNTFVVEDRSADLTFVNGVDLIVALTGLVDLSHTSINTTDASLLIG
jgi:S-layer protein